MKSRMADGPYDKMILQLPWGLDHVQLPVTVTTALPDHVNPGREFLCQARYRLISQNDVEQVFQFVSVGSGRPV